MNMMTKPEDDEVLEGELIAPGEDTPETLLLRAADAVQGIAMELGRKAENYVAKKALIEQRWIKDLRQYYGKYDPETEATLKESGGSMLFVNLTRPKTDSWEARLGDLLFPTDDKNWGLKPTPVPALLNAVDRARSKPDAAGSEQVQAIGRTEQDEARRKAEAMERAIDDAFVESKYVIRSRDAIGDATKLGTGIMKGPIVASRTRKSWQQDPGSGQHLLAEVADVQPGYTRVDPWSWFPDPNARTIEEMEDCFERHLMTPKEVRALQHKGFDKAALRRLLSAKPTRAVPTFLAEVRALADGQSLADDFRYEVWEYHGPLSCEQLCQLAMHTGDKDTIELYGEIDPLTEIQVVLWFSESQVLKFGPHPLDSGECIYSAFSFVKDEGSVFGLGVPYLVRDAQRALNSAWRGMMDNGALSTGPQIVIDQARIEPADGDWKLKPRKPWLVKAGVTLPQGGDIRSVFATFHIESRQQELERVIQLAKSFMDDEASLPLIAQGESGSHQTQTAQGMAMLQNASNVIFRRAVKAYDDDMTTPNVRRVYDWLMQHSPDAEIKGDMQVDARGSSVLLVREVQAQNLMVMASQFTAHPVLGPLTKAPQLYRKLVQAHMLPADEIVQTEEEIAEMQARAAEQGAPEDPRIAIERERLAFEQQDHAADREFKIALAEMERDTAMMRFAAEANLTLEQLRATLANQQADRDSKERIWSAEAAFKSRQSDIERATSKDVPDGTRFGP